ncbi:F-box protein At5g49610-like [Solanum pennellii]|uniref:F-box protein At5g49610-like n=1 Tax=Solanum pennellii TaxID=28526 RepID=A0ABM1HKQ7_SOLPN|nr:F-box protein At5g49610-like [Solanum pennellii]
MGDEIDDIEFARQMLSLKENKYEENKSGGMKQVVKKSHKISTLSDLPDGILFNILVKIPPKDIHKYVMRVCRSWKEIVSESFFIEQNFMESKTELVIQSGLGRRMKTKLIEIRKEFECESREVGLSKLSKIHSSCDGFLLMSEPGNNGMLQIINPATKFCLTIPRCPSHCHHKACSAALAFDSSTKQYKVVHVVTDSYGFEIFNVSSDNDELHWERVSSPWEDLNDRPFNPINFHWKNPVSINGRILHWYVDSAEYFITMQVKEEKFSRTYLPERVKQINKKKNYALVELDGFLSFINCDSEKTMNVWVLEDFRRKVWFKKHTIVAELTNYICPYKSSRQDERRMPRFWNLVAVAGARNGEVLIIEHKKNSSVFIYDTKSKVMKPVSSNMKKLESFVPHKDGLFRIMKSIA